MNFFVPNQEKANYLQIDEEIRNKDKIKIDRRIYKN